MELIWHGVLKAAELVFGLDGEVWSITWRSLQISGCATFISLLIGVANILRLVEIDDFLGDVCRVIGDSLDGFGDHHEAQAPSDGGGTFHHVARQLAVELAVEIVDVRVARNHGAGTIGFPINEGRDRVP
jgi:hypothetical protein